jgi:hypothetical protein
MLQQMLSTVANSRKGRMVKIIDNSHQRRGIAGKIGRTSTARSGIYYQASTGQIIHAGSDDGNSALLSSGRANSLVGENRKQVPQIVLHESFKYMATLESNVKAAPAETPKKACANNSDPSIESNLESAHTMPLNESAPTEVSNCLSLSFDRDEGDDWSISRNDPFQLTCKANDKQERSNAHSSAKIVAGQLLGHTETRASLSLDMPASTVSDCLGAPSQLPANDTRLPNIVGNQEDQQESDLRCYGNMNYRQAAAAVDSNNHREEPVLLDKADCNDTPPNFAASQASRLSHLEEEIACLREAARQHALERQDDSDRHQAEIRALNAKHAIAIETVSENHNRTVADLKNQIALLRGDDPSVWVKMGEAERLMQEWDRVKQIEHQISTGDSTLPRTRKGTGKKRVRRVLLEDDQKQPVDPVTDRACSEATLAFSTFVTYQGQILSSLKRRRSNSRYVVRSPSFSS